MATLINVLPSNHDIAIIVPGKPTPLTFTYDQLVSQISSFRRKLAGVGIGPRSAVSIALPNSPEFIV
jgi:acyl-CoA synthetase (AMP-forming)/AMP-acid ligase II